MLPSYFLPFLPNQWWGGSVYISFLSKLNKRGNVLVNSHSNCANTTFLNTHFQTAQIRPSFTLAFKLRKYNLLLLSPLNCAYTTFFTLTFKLRKCDLPLHSHSNCANTTFFYTYIQTALIQPSFTLTFKLRKYNILLHSHSNCASTIFLYTHIQTAQIQPSFTLTFKLRKYNLPLHSPSNCASTTFLYTHIQTAQIRLSFIICDRTLPRPWLVSWCFEPSQPQRAISGLSVRGNGPWRSNQVRQVQLFTCQLV